MKRSFVGVTLIAFLAFSPADPALAHGGNGGSSSDYRVEITGFTGDHSGIELRSVEFGNRVEIRRTTAREVIVLGYSGEPYLRLDTSGVWENLNSPAHYLNLDRFASKAPPASATADAKPNWQQLNSGTSARWHDHRAHWMGSIPPVEVQANPGVERVIFPANHLDMVVDGNQVSALVRVTWLPPPSKTPWLLAISVLTSLLIVALVQVKRLGPIVPHLVVIGALYGLLGQGYSAIRVITACVALAIAVIGALLRRRLVSVVAALLVGVLAATRLEVFEHQLLQGVLDALWQRISIAVALVTAIAVVFAQVVAWLSPKPVTATSSATTAAASTASTATTAS
jgi:hypothetical protein